MLVEVCVFVVCFLCGQASFLLWREKDKCIFIDVSALFCYRKTQVENLQNDKFQVRFAKLETAFFNGVNLEHWGLSQLS